MMGPHPCHGHSAQRASRRGIAGWDPTLADSWGTIFGSNVSNRWSDDMSLFRLIHGRCRSSSGGPSLSPLSTNLARCTL